ncbi:outer membrane beta-barrel protein [Flavisolibacter nicotianae]|uniref:outer membrane beta-barrel protein n=1 Tax=Flavisolibacter nicotianae TaxID=2364882 RepID=UPI000EB52A12|nr:outer membrane beta-barrel protein [Flavisolibacter nicotianae]
MKQHKIVLLLLVFLFALGAQAQRKGSTQFDIQLNAGLPVGSLKNAVSDHSLRGIKASVLYAVDDQLAIGLGTGFQDFYQKYPRQLYKLSDGSDMSAVRSFSIQVIPILAEAKWNFSPDAAVRPYAALGLGGNLINYNDYVGEFSLDQKTKIGFAARPDLGVYIPFRKGGESGMTVGASFNFMPFTAGDVTNLNHVGIHAGFSLPLRK